MTTKSGLDDVVAADTVLSEVDGGAGRLVIRGYALSQLVGRRHFEQVLQLLLDGLLEALGIPREAFTCVFAMGRVGGWIAHAREQVLHGRLIRPQSRYVGPVPQQAA